METKSDILIVGAFERGWYLASTLASDGLKVIYIDVTETLGKFGTDEMRTPFGFYLPEDPKVLEFLNKFEFKKSERGLTYLLEDGPVELGSPLAAYRFRSVLERLPRSEDLFNDYGTNLFDGLKPLESSDSAHLPTRSFFGPLLTHEVIKKAHTLMKNAGVWVLERSEVLDISIRRGVIEGIEVRGDTSAFLSSPRLVWTLSDHETAAILSDRVEKLRSKEISDPDWLWINYRFQWTPPNKMIPDYLIVVADLDLPWCHSNYLIMDRLPTVSADKRQDCIWARIPINQRFQKSYLEDLGTDIQKLLEGRFRSQKFEILSYPEEMTKEKSEKGVVRFGLDTPRQRDRRGFKSIRGLYDLSPFSLDNEGWDLRLEKETQLGAQIKSEWLTEQQKRKGEKVDSTIQPT